MPPRTRSGRLSRPGKGFATRASDSATTRCRALAVEQDHLSASASRRLGAPDERLAIAEQWGAMHTVSVDKYLSVKDRLVLAISGVHA